MGIAPASGYILKSLCPSKVGGVAQQLTNERGAHSHQEKTSSSNFISSTPTIGLSILSGQGRSNDQLLSVSFRERTAAEMLELSGVTTVLLDIGESSLHTVPLASSPRANAPSA